MMGNRIRLIAEHSSYLTQHPSRVGKPRPPPFNNTVVPFHCKYRTVKSCSVLKVTMKKLLTHKVGLFRDRSTMSYTMGENTI